MLTRDCRNKLILDLELLLDISIISEQIIRSIQVHHTHLMSELCHNALPDVKMVIMRILKDISSRMVEHH